MRKLAIFSKLYHVTPVSNVPTILDRGLEPHTPEDFKDEKAVYLFKNKVSAEEAVLNWLGDRFEEDEVMSLLSVDEQKLKELGIQVYPSTAEYEVLVKTTIPPGAIKLEKKNF